MQNLDKPIHYRIDHRRHAYLIGNFLDHGPTIMKSPQSEELDLVREARDYFIDLKDKEVGVDQEDLLKD